MTGTVGVLLRAKEEGLVAALGPIVERLQEGGIYLGPRLVAEALRLARE